MYWWVELGYSDAFDVGRDGYFPRTGQVVKYYRERKMDERGKAWTQKGLAKTLGVTENTIRDIENKDTIMSFERRQFLCKLFSIPPILLGVMTPAEIDLLVERHRQANASAVVFTPKVTNRKLTIDVVEYNQLLRTLWVSYKNCTIGSPMSQVLFGLNALYQELPHVREQAPIQELLCGYHEFAAHVLRDNLRYEEALEHLDKSLNFSEALDRDDLRAVMLYRKGNTYDDVDYIDEAEENYEEAKFYEKRIPSNMRGSIFLCGGLTGAKTARTEDEKLSAINLIDSVGTIVRTGSREEDPHFLKLDLNHYHLDRGAALIAIGRNKDALAELNLVRCGPEYPRRQAYADILRAQAYVNRSKWEQAANLAEFALEIFLQVNSQVNVARVVKVFQQLQESPYKDSPDVARIDYLLYKKPRAR